MKLKILIPLVFIIIVFTFSTPALARPLFESSTGTLLTSYTPKQITDMTRGLIKAATTPPAGEAPQLGPPPTKPVYQPGTVTISASRNVVGPGQWFRLRWNATPDNRGDLPKCYKDGTPAESPTGGSSWSGEAATAGDVVLILPDSMAEANHNFGIRCYYKGNWVPSNLAKVFLDKPVKAYISADAGGRYGVSDSITVNVGESVKINWSALDALAAPGTRAFDVAECYLSGGSFNDKRLFSGVRFENNSWRLQGSEIIPRAENATYTITCYDYFSQGVQDSVTVQVGTICPTNECTPGQTQCVNNEQYKYCADSDPGPGTCYRWSSQLISCIPGAHCSGNQCLDDKTGEPRMPTGDKTDKTDKEKLDWDKLLEELNKADSTKGQGETDGNGGAGGAGFPAFGSTQCYDGKDNDNDGKIDNGVTKTENGVKKYYPPDPGCQDKDGKYDPNDKFEFQYRLKEVIPDFFNLDWFKLDFVNLFKAEALAR